MNNYDSSGGGYQQMDPNRQSRNSNSAEIPILNQISSFDIKDESQTHELRDIAQKISDSKHFTSTEQKNLATELRIQEWEASKTKKLYSYFVLIVICIANMGGNWENGLLAPAYNYPYQTLPTNQVPYYWIGTVIGDTVNFSTISGPAMLVPMLLSSFCAGMLAEKLNRKWLFLASLGLVAICTCAMAFSNNFAQILGLNVVIGFVLAFTTPALISLITDYFPQNRQTSAFAVFSIFTALASSLGALTTIFIGLVGWRMTYGAIGAFFTAYSFLALFMIKEPKRYQFAFESKDQEGNVNNGNPVMAIIQQYTSISKVACLRWVYLGLFLLTWSTSGNTAYGLRYFNYYNQPTVFAAYKAAVMLIGVVVASMFYAQLADRLQPRFIKIKPYIISFQLLMAAIFSLLIYSFFVNFWLAAGLYGLTFIICGGINPPLLAILADSPPKGTQGSAISLFIIIASLASMTSSMVLAKFLPQESSLGHLQKVLAINGSVPMLLAAFCFYMSSFDYARIMGEIKHERTEAIAKAIEIAPEIAQMNARQTINIDPQIFNDALKKIEVLDGNTTRGRNSAFNLNDSDAQFPDLKNQKRTKSTGFI